MENKRQLQSRKSKGLVSKLIAPVLIGIAGLMPMSKAEGGYIQPTTSGFSGVSDNSVRLYHQDGATDVYDASMDTIYSPRAPPAIDFFSKITDYDLSRDKRGLDSISTFHTLLQGKDDNDPLTLPNNIYPLSGNLSFIIADSNNDFGSLPIWADIFDKDGNPYTNGSTTYTNIDVRDYASKGTTIPLSLASNSDVYNIDVRFSEIPEPSTLSLLAMAGIGAGAGYLASRRKKEEK